MNRVLKAGRQKGKAVTNRRKTIQLTSLLDAFTILLVFLLKNFATDNTLAIALGEGVNIPAAKTTGSLESLPFITVSHTTIMVNEETITNKGINGVFTESEYRRVGERIVVQADMMLIYYPGHPGEIVIAADRDIPAYAVKRLMAIATLAGFGKIRLAATKRGDT